MENVRRRLDTHLRHRYAIQHELGSGATAVVYLADDLKHDRRVALKVLRPELAAALGSKRFHREIEVVSSLVHPHILPLFDSGEADGLLFYVMPYVEGESLRDRLGRERSLRVDAAVSIASEIADALAYAHQHGVVHRDVKPANIMLSDGHALLADFGIARLVDAVEDGSGTRPGISPGTPVYMSPEQVSGDETIDGRSDVYSLGCVLFEMLAGEPPFTGPNSRAILTAHLTDSPRALDSVRADIPQALSATVSRTLEKEPRDRPGAAEIAKTLAEEQRMLDPVGRTEPHEARLKPRLLQVSARRRVALALVMVAVIALSLPILWSAVRPPEEAFAIADPRGSYIVIPFDESATTAQEQAVAARVAAVLTSQLNRWRGIRAVEQYAIEGPVFDRFGRTTSTFGSLQEALELALDQRIGTLVALTVRVRGDSAFLDAALFDVATGNELGPTVQSAAGVRDFHRLAEPVTIEAIGFRGSSTDLASIRRLSDSPEAVNQYFDGRDYLYRWRLVEAERAFRAAIQEDSTFALPNYYLAVTLYWKTADEQQLIFEHGPEIASLLATSARLHEADGSVDQLRIEGFRQFWSGDFERARATYREILGRDSTDSEAWLFTGVVEHEDPSVLRTDSGELRPRRNVNLALLAFQRAVTITPSFLLGYGNTFAILESVYDAARGISCPAFLLPDLAPDEPWASRREAVDYASSFCPIAEDSIVWVKPGNFAGDLARARIGAVRLEASVRAEIERWVRFSPDEPRPRKQLAEWLLALRTTLGAAADTAQAAAVTREALLQMEMSLMLREDTTSEEMVRLGALHLATGDLQSAVALTESGLRELADVRDLKDSSAVIAPIVAANLYLARGQPSRATMIGEPLWRTYTVSAWDPERQRSVPGGRVEPSLSRVRAFGAAASVGPALLEALAHLTQTWSAPSTTARDALLLRRSQTGTLAAGLAADSAARTAWFEDWDTIPPLWRGLMVPEADTAAASLYLDEALQEEHRSGIRPRLEIDYAMSLLAQRAGRHPTAIERCTKIIGSPHRVDTIDFGWGLRSVCLFVRASSLSAQGDRAAAIRDYSRFITIWADAEREGRAMLSSARDALAWLQSDG